MDDYKQRMLATLRGEPTDQIPFVPRMDLWYKANKRKGTLPDQYKNASLMDIVEDLGVGYHAVVPDFRGFKDPLDDVDRALGIWRIEDCPYRVVLKGVRRNINYEGDYRTTEYITPYGNVKAVTRYTEEHKAAGITLTDIVERVIKDEDDYEAVAYIFENAEVIPSYDSFLSKKEKVGNRGLVVAYANLAASPMHAIQRYLMDYKSFFINIKKNPKKLEWLASKLQKYFDKVFEVVSDCPAKVILSGANYDSTVTYPPLFKRYFKPALKNQAEILHQSNQYLLTHTDGENEGLLEYFIESGIDIADSVCPKPMTKLSLKEYREAFEGKITIWGGIPSVALLESSMSDKRFKEYMDDLFSNQIGKGDHLILSIADTVPPEAKFERIERIATLCEEFGPVTP